MATSAPPSIAAAFALFDVDGDGSLSVAEMQQVLQRPGGGAPLSDEEVQAVIDEFDENGDGVLQIEEFARMWAPMLEAFEKGDASLDDEDEPSAATTVSAESSPQTSEASATPDAQPEAVAPPMLPIGNSAGTKKKSSISRMRDSFKKATSQVGGSFKKGSSFAKRKKAKSQTATALAIADKPSARGVDKPSARGVDKPSARGSAPARGGAAANGRHSHFGPPPPQRQMSTRNSSSKTQAPAEPAERLRSSKDLVEACASEEEKAVGYEERASKHAFDTFERQLGAALVLDDKARAVTNGEKHALSDLIRSWDKNNDGEISVIEFRQAVRGSLRVKAHNDEIDALFKSFDAGAYTGFQPAPLTSHARCATCLASADR